MYQKRLKDHSVSSLRNNSFSMTASNNNLMSMNQSEHFNARIKNIIDHKAILDSEYLKEIDPKKYRQNIFRMLKQSKITDKINRDGILDDLLTEMKQDVGNEGIEGMNEANHEILNKFKISRS
tara:strand:- start:1809 stop:2177 length:369 start_codon:yes stop_codon:yes gene_type:complete